MRKGSRREMRVQVIVLNFALRLTLRRYSYLIASAKVFCDAEAIP